MNPNQLTVGDIQFMWAQVVQDIDVESFTDAQWQETYEEFVEWMLSDSEPYMEQPNQQQLAQTDLPMQTQQQELEKKVEVVESDLMCVKSEVNPILNKSDEQHSLQPTVEAAQLAKAASKGAVPKLVGKLELTEKQPKVQKELHQVLDPKTTVKQKTDNQSEDLNLSPMLDKMSLAAKFQGKET